MSIITLFFIVGCSGGKSRVFQIEYNGDPLWCIAFDGGYGGTSGGVACDFELYWREDHE